MTQATQMTQIDRASLSANEERDKLISFPPPPSTEERKRYKRSLPKPAIAANECVSRAIVSEPGFTGTLKLRNNAISQYLPQFNAPLIERIDMPDGALNKDLVLVKSDQLTQLLRCHAIREDSVCGP